VQNDSQCLGGTGDGELLLLLVLVRRLSDEADAGVTDRQQAHVSVCRAALHTLQPPLPAHCCRRAATNLV